jgi:DNA-binding NarL/FixJ family response regulator
MPTLRVLLADDHESVRRSLRSLIEFHEGWQICGEAVDGRDAIKKIKRLQPDLVVLDIGMPYLSGLEVVREIKRSGPETKILIVTIHSSEHVAREAWDCGAKGFISKSDAARDLVRAIELIQRGKVFFPEMAATLHATASASSGTPREL